MKHRARDLRIRPEYLKEREEFLTSAGWPKSKWISFCETLLDRGYRVYLYEARETKSKYITVTRENSPLSFKVRFSDHMPNKYKQLQGDCDFFVGKTHLGWTNTADAMNAVEMHFSQKSEAQS